MLQVIPEQLEWLKEVHANMVADEGESISAEYFLSELKRLISDDGIQIHHFDCKCAIHR